MAELKGKIEVEVKEMTSVKGMTTCKVCGRDFPLIAEERYTARNKEMSGVIPTIKGDQESDWYDAFDCPHCGCQNLVQERMRLVTDRFDFEDIDLEGEDNDE